MHQNQFIHFAIIVNKHTVLGVNIIYASINDQFKGMQVNSFFFFNFRWEMKEKENLEEEEKVIVEHFKNLYHIPTPLVSDEDKLEERI